MALTKRNSNAFEILTFLHKLVAVCLSSFLLSILDGGGSLVDLL